MDGTETYVQLGVFYSCIRSDADHGIVQPLSLFGDSLMYGFPVNPIAQLSHDA